MYPLSCDARLGALWDIPRKASRVRKIVMFTVALIRFYKSALKIVRHKWCKDRCAKTKKQRKKFHFVFLYGQPCSDKLTGPTSWIWRKNINLSRALQGLSVRQNDGENWGGERLYSQFKLLQRKWERRASEWYRFPTAHIRERKKESADTQHVRSSAPPSFSVRHCLTVLAIDNGRQYYGLFNIRPFLHFVNLKKWPKTCFKILFITIYRISLLAS